MQHIFDLELGKTNCRVTMSIYCIIGKTKQFFF